MSGSEKETTELCPGSVIAFGPVISRLKRLLLILVLAFAVPGQGLAAVSAGICMALSHHDAPAALGGHDHGQHGGGGADSGTADADQGDAHCGPCAACCGTASISSSVVPLGSDAPRAAIEMHPVTQPARFLLDGLDRPPLAL